MIKRDEIEAEMEKKNEKRMRYLHKYYLLAIKGN